MAATTSGSEHLATAKALSLPISTKHCIMISYHLRYHSVKYAQDCLENVIKLRTPIPFHRFNKDRGHKAGISAGRFPEKAAREFLRLVKSVEANAQAKGLDPSNLKIVKLIANKASIPSTGRRLRHSTKRTHLEIAVQEGSARKKKEAGKQSSARAESTAIPVKKESKKGAQ